MTTESHASDRVAIAAIQSCFARGERVVTLHGAEGIGKTALARRFVRGPGAPCSAALGEGTPVAWCACATARDRDDLLRCLARALSAPSLHDDPLSHLCESLSVRGDLLLVLDDLDAAPGAAREVLAELVAGCPELRVLAIARAPLDLDSEACVELSPLGPEAAEQMWRSFGAALDDADDREALASLGGNPLAIEIAAQGDSASLGRLRQTGGNDPVTRALAAVWSTLDEALRACVAEASVFEDGFSLEAAEAVFSAGSSAAMLLSDLAARHLVRVSEEPPARRVRFSLDAPVRAFAARELERSGRGPDLIDRHALHMLSRGAEWVAEYGLRGDPAGVVALDREQANLAAVGRRADEARGTPADRAQRRVLARFFQTLSVLRTTGVGAHLDALDRELDDAIAAGASEATLLPVWAARAFRDERAGRSDEAVAALEHAASRAASIGREDLAGHLFRGIAIVRGFQGRFDEALAAADRARVTLERCDRVGESAWALLLTGRVLHDRGAFDDATGVLTRTLLRAREHSNELVEARALLTLGEAELALGRHDGARLHLREALAAFHRVHDPAGVATTHEALARLLHDQGRTDASLAEFQAAVDQAAQLGEATMRARAEVSLAALLHEFGHLNEARALLDRTNAVLAPRAPRVAAFASAHLAAVLASLGDHEAAEREIDRAREAATTPSDRFSPVIRALRVFVILCKAREYPPRGGAARGARGEARARGAARAAS